MSSPKLHIEPMTRDTALKFLRGDRGAKVEVQRHIRHSLTAALDSQPEQGDEGTFTSDEKSLLIARLARGKSKLGWRADAEEAAIGKLMRFLDDEEDHHA